MSKENSKKSGFFKRLGNQYRIVFIDDNSLEEVASYKLTMRKLYILFSTVFVLISLISISLILYTPIKYYIPGYAGGSTRLKVIKLKQTVDSLSDRVAAQELYEENLRNVITGNIKTEKDTSLLDLQKYNQERKRSLLKTEEIKRNAIKQVEAENKKKND